MLPDDIAQRPKRPYRAPIHRAFFNGRRPDYLADLLSPSRVRAAGLFNAAAVSGIVGKLERGMPLGEADDMALAGIISTQLVMEQFVWNFRVPPPLDGNARVKLCMAKELARI